ncbi:zinc-finger homeodomain protein 8-like [Phoenix dactylifera]|uniref:Zinc-finger homeodomain protein 8-like n=1 Tax=Phoenix dactylifera TaxID=42345 RepID=A0A8B7CW24_PHODC|nr:zinc-finger homeodomain protein 8-like [Phoenix dactylifera]XP_038986699.1 zinc-finger homeodomain protein 8-like [Phoenix dactylifera]
MDLSVVLYGETGRSKVDRGREPRAADLGASGGGGGEKYRECMRNHAAAIGGQAYDGCGEFMPGGEEGTLEALKCAACGCHRNFHRRAGFSSGDPCGPLLLKAAPPPSGFPVFLPPPPHPMPLPFHAIRPPPPPPPPQPTACQVDRSRVGSETPPRPEEAAAASEGPRGAARKRYRTKFTQEQKEKMQAFAEKLGWRIQKHDVVALEEFCVEVGVKRHVLKVWMHNNKNHLSSSSSSSSVAVAVSAAAAPKPDATSAPPIRV